MHKLEITPSRSAAGIFRSIDEGVIRERHMCAGADLWRSHNGCKGANAHSLGPARPFLFFRISRIRTYVDALVSNKRCLCEGMGWRLNHKVTSTHAHCTMGAVEKSDHDINYTLLGAVCMRGPKNCPADWYAITFVHLHGRAYIKQSLSLRAALPIFGLRAYTHFKDNENLSVKV